MAVFLIAINITYCRPTNVVEEDDLTQTDARERGKVKYVEHLTVPHLEGATEARRLSGCNVGR